MRHAVIAAAIVFLARTAAAQPPGGTISGKVLVLQHGKAVPPPPHMAYVYLVDKTRPRPDPASLPHARIIQQDTEFVPHVLVIPKGTIVEFPNMERTPVAHNVFSPSPFFDLGRYMPSARPQPHKLFDVADKPTVEHQIYCDIHMCMWARIKVVDVLGPEDIHELGPDGSYEFRGVPPGQYEVWAWAVASTAVSSGPQTLAAGAALKIGVIKLQLGELEKSHKNKLGRSYDPYAGRCPAQ